MQQFMTSDVKDYFVPEYLIRLNVYTTDSISVRHVATDCEFKDIYSVVEKFIFDYYGNNKGYEIIEVKKL